MAALETDTLAEADAPTGVVSVLVVNSRPEPRARITTVLGQASFDVACCATAAEAFALLRVAPRAALVVDHALTDMAGVAFVQACAAAGHEARAVMTAREPRVAAAVDAIRAGVSDFLPEPFDARLAEAVRRALDEPATPVRAAVRGSIPPRRPT